MAEGLSSLSPSYEPPPEARAVADETDVLRRWDSRIAAIARRAARTGKWRRAGADVLAARLQWALVRAIRRSPVRSDQWVGRVLANEVRDWARHLKIETAFQYFSEIVEEGDDEHEHYEPEAPHETQPYVGVCRREACKHVRAWIEALPGRRRRLLHLLYDCGHTQERVARELGVSRARVAQFHRQALDLGRQALAAVA